jgi:hypothetical protein
MSIFYTEVPKKVQEALTLRKQYYSSGTNVVRDAGTHAWLYRKTAYAEASATNPRNLTSAFLRTSRQGGIGKDSLYTSNNDANWIPKPHINSVKISSDGDLGSLLKCEIAFTVYTLTDLDAYQPFLDLGSNVSVTYGWSAGGTAAGKEGNFQGVIYNFSYSVNAAGGFDCITYGMSAGNTILPVNITAGAEINSQTVDALGNTYASVNLIDILDKLAESTSVADHFVQDGIGKVTLRYNLADEEYKPHPASKVESYITLEKLVTLINENLLRDFILGDIAATANIFSLGQGPVPINPVTQLQAQQNAAGNLWYLRNNSLVSSKDFLIICNADYTKGIMPKNREDLVSANPLQMLFPGYSTYGSAKFFDSSTELNTQFQKGDLSKILLNINWIKKLFVETGTETQDRQKSADQSITKFLLNIFNAISDNSGTRFKLSLTTDPENTKRFIISDINYVDGNITPYILTAVNNQGICRSISLTSNVPSAMSAVAFISANSTATTQSTKGGTVINKTTATVKKETIDAIRTKLKETIQKFAVSTIKETDIAQLRSLLKRVYEFVPFNAGNLGVATAKTSIPFPIDFSATLDGIDGFTFGNTVTTNYLPSVYKNTRVAFTIKKIDHVIQNNDWTTTISTICRLSPDEINASTENAYVDDRSNQQPVQTQQSTVPRTPMPIPVANPGGGGQPAQQFQ